MNFRAVGGFVVGGSSVMQWSQRCLKEGGDEAVTKKPHSVVVEAGGGPVQLRSHLLLGFKPNATTYQLSGFSSQRHYFLGMVIRINWDSMMHKYLEKVLCVVGTQQMITTAAVVTVSSMLRQQPFSGMPLMFLRGRKKALLLNYEILLAIRGILIFVKACLFIWKAEL